MYPSFFLDVLLSLEAALWQNQYGQMNCSDPDEDFELYSLSVAAEQIFPMKTALYVVQSSAQHQ